MLRIAAQFAEEVRAVGLVTGESIGQKSSQTSSNLYATSAVTDLPVHRPLLAMDKAEITEQARDIGTFDDATIPAGCNRVAPSFPETAASPADAAATEPDDIEELARAAAASITVPELSASAADD
jgi:thiamine biosynthesis protein ThiI